MDAKKLIKEAIKAREMSYSPYSKYMVGAALLGKDGNIYTGCNIENAAYTPTNCAERTAIFKAVSCGVKEFEAIAIVGYAKGGVPHIGQYAAPCGVCRQVLMEFVNPKEFSVIMANSEEDYQIQTLLQLLPMGFGPDNLK
ncbi:MAG: cytidine deaminase [Lachnospiraceae bacterium]|nr:cytidine deaminase [Lachnospiraceae bacterium]